MTTKQELIAHFVSVGIPKFVAKRMAKLTNLTMYTPEQSANECILAFAGWDSTPEGYDFWSALETHFSKERK